MRIRYKVVTTTRKSCTIPIHSKYCRTYTKGKIVKAVPESFGIMVFKDKRSARDFSYMRGENQILKVRVIGRKKIPKIIGLVYNDPRKTTIKLNQFHAGNNYDCTVLIPAGTECYPEVEVLE